MLAQLLRAPGGRVIFMEASSELVDALGELLNRPLGAVLAACTGPEPSCDRTGGDRAGGGTSPLGVLVASMGRLRPEVLNEEDILPKPVDVKQLLAEAARPRSAAVGGRPAAAAPPPAAAGTAEPAGCVMCFRMGYTQQPEQHTPGPCKNCGQPTSKRCPQTGYGLCCRLTFLNACVGEYHYCVACAVSTGQNYYTNGSKVCDECGVAKAHVCHNCTSCDACGVRSAGFLLDGMKVVQKQVPVPEAETQQPRPRLAKETVKFLITNDLEIFESSSVKAFELISASVNSFDGVKHEAVRITAQHLLLILRYAFQGCPAILDRTFPAADTSDTDSVNSSFELVPAKSALRGPSELPCPSCGEAFADERGLASHRAQAEH